MEASSGSSPRLNSEHQSFEMDSSDHNIRSDHRFYSQSVLEILRETVRILRHNSKGFMGIAALLICPVSAVLLSNVLVNQVIVKRLTIRLLLVVKSSGLPLKPFIKQSCQNISERAVAAAMCFPLYATLLLMSKAAVVYSVDCTYSRKVFDVSKFYVTVRKIWWRVLLTYLWACMVIVGCVTLCLVLLVAVSGLLSIIGFPPDLIVYTGIIVGLVLSIFFANAIVICDLAIVVSVLEDVVGSHALLRSSMLIRGQIQVGLMIFLVSTIGLAFVEGLFEHRVKTLSYGDGSSRLWEGPLLVLMYSFVVLVGSMMSAVFYFSCKSYSLESSNEECQPVLEVSTMPPDSSDVQ